MHIHEVSDKNSVMLSIKGNLDETTSQTVESKMWEVLSKEAKKIVLNLEGVEYISSIGIRILILAHKKAVESGKKFTIDKMSEKVRITLKMLGILPIFIPK